MAPLMLICSRDAEFCLMMRDMSETEGFDYEIAETIEEVTQHCEAGNVLAVIVDCQPDLNLAPAICTRLKTSEATAGVLIVAFLTPACENRYLEMLKAGVDQAFMRPLAPQWLRTCFRSMFSPRQEKIARPSEDGNIIFFGNIRILVDKYRVQRDDGKIIPFGPIEFRLLCEMSRLPGQVFSREELIKAAWPANIFVELRTVDVHIGRLRRLLQRETGTNLIRTVRSAGYAMEVAA